MIMGLGGDDDILNSPPPPPTPLAYKYKPWGSFQGFFFTFVLNSMGRLQKLRERERGRRRIGGLELWKLYWLEEEWLAY